MKFLKNNKYFLFGLAVLFFVIWANIFPKGYVFAGGDTAQLISAKSSFIKMFYDWEGRAGVFYFVFFILSSIGISDSSQLSWYLGIYLIGSYCSFYIFIRLIIINVSGSLKTFSSLFYALNLYTLFLFTGNTGFSSYPSLYIFIPLLCGFFLKLLETNKLKFSIFFALTLLLGSSGFGNPAFFISLFIFLSSILILSIIFKGVVLDRKLILSLSGLVMLALLASAFWILSLLPQMRSGVEGIATSEVLDLNTVLRSTASPIWNTLSLIHFSQDHFPSRFPYKDINYLKDIFILLAFVPIFIILWGAVIFKKFGDRNKKYFVVFLGAMAVMTMLAARVTAPFETANHYLYNLWGMNTLRGFDKTGIFLPFMLAFLMTIVMSEIRKEKTRALLMIAVLLIPLPFYLGKLQQNVGYRFSSGKNYRTASMSFLIKIPQNYYKIRKTINDDQEKSFIVSLPSTRNDGSGISDFPKWKLYGVDITQFLYNKKFIQANGSYFGKWNFAESFNDDSSGQYGWLIKLLGLMNGKYIIYHKDASSDSVQKSLFKMDQLEKEGFIYKKEENEYFNLYEIDDQYRVDYISWQNGGTEVIKNPEIIKRSAENIREKISGAKFQEINPKKFSIDPGVAHSSRDLVLAEVYNSNWKAYAIDSSGKETEIKSHFLARGYANGWKVPNNPGIKKIIVEYYPIRLMWRGIIISLATALFLILYLLRYYYVQRKSKKIA